MNIFVRYFLIRNPILHLKIKVFYLATLPNIVSSTKTQLKNIKKMFLRKLTFFVKNKKTAHFLKQLFRKQKLTANSVRNRF